MRRSAIYATVVSALLIAGAACGSPLASVTDGRLPVGSWGGPHIGVVSTTTDVFFIFDCASGHVDGPLRLNGSGNFDVMGTYTGGGNAIGADHSPHPAHFVGNATGSTFTVTMTITDGTHAGPSGLLTATRDAPAQVMAC